MNKNKVVTYSEEHFEQSINKLKELIKIPSISFPGYPSSEVNKCAQKCFELLKDSGLENIQQIFFEDSAPFIYGDIIVDKNKPTILLYAHYDVQPEMRSEFWDSPAFEPIIRNGRLYGRGAADDKAGVILHSESINAFIKTNSKLNVNLKIILEGEEEVASPGLENFIDKHKELLSADVVIVADMANYQVGIPAITTSLRGMIAVEVEVNALKTPLHSGLWGGPLPDPAMEITKIISQLTDDNSKINIPEYYKMITSPTKEELEAYKSLNMTTKLFKEQSGLLEGNDLIANEENLLIKLWREPSLIISAIQSGDKKTAGNVLMNSAWARIGLRLAPGMEKEQSLKLLLSKLNDITKKYKQDGKKLNTKITPEQGGANPWSCSTDHPYFKLSKEALTEAYGNPAVFIGCGATIPFVGSLCEKLGGIPALLIGVEDPDTKAHSENESVHLEDLKNAIQAQILFFQKLGQY